MRCFLITVLVVWLTWFMLGLVFGMLALGVK